jgi:hypothetical protein
MIGGGYSTLGVTATAEIIDLETTKSNCLNFPLLPRGGFGSAGAFVDNDHPIVCGGFNYVDAFDR